jgi:hypothetical protein
MPSHPAGLPYLSGRIRAAALLWMGALPGAAWADFEEVRIVRTDPIQVQICPAPGQVVQAPQAGLPPAPAPQPQAQPQPQNTVVGGLTGKEILGGVAGAAVGGLLGNQVGSGSGRTAATVAGAGVGAYAGYKLAQDKPPPAPPPQVAQPVQAPCTLASRYRVYYARPNGLQGDVMMSAPPTGASLMINFCGERPCN